MRLPGAPRGRSSPALTSPLSQYLGRAWGGAGHSGLWASSLYFLLACLFFCEEGVRSRAVGTGVAPDKGRKASGEIGARELSVAGEISKAGCEGNDLYLSPRYSSIGGWGEKLAAASQRGDAPISALLRASSCSHHRGVSMVLQSPQSDGETELLAQSAEGSLSLGSPQFNVGHAGWTFWSDGGDAISSQRPMRLRSGNTGHIT